MLSLLSTTTQAASEPIRIAMIEGLSGSFANAGEAVHRNLLLAVERVNARGGVQLPGGARPLELLRFDTKGSTDETLSMLKAALDKQVGVVMQGNSSAAAAVLIDALNKAKPQGVKGIYLRKVSVSSTMGAGVRIDTAGMAQSTANA
jgi:branched-chain amino acid transport system substrate-binding protein